MEYNLVLFITIIHRMHYVFGDILAEQLLLAEPIHPMVKVQEIAPIEGSVDFKIENGVAFEGTFRPLAACKEKKELKLFDYGSITTPNYPRRYPASAQCEWLLESPLGTRIQATIFDLYTQPWFFTYFDYVMIAKDGNFSMVNKIVGDMNQKTPMTIKSSSNRFGVRFISSLLFNFRGLKMEYLVVPEDAGSVKLQATAFNNHCGSSPLLEEDRLKAGRKGNLDDHIISPDFAVPGTFPWQVALLLDSRSFCGGSIIDQQHIMTAAHCTDRVKKITVLVGAHNIKADKAAEPNRIVFNITRDNIFQHPEYNRNSITHDITIIKLPEKLVFNEYVKPICLPNRYYLSETFTGDTVRVSGWGKPADDAAGISPILKNTTVKVMPNSECRRMFRGLVTGNLICTETRENASPCRGDSGGPLIVKEIDKFGNKYFMQVGIVSFGGNSCEKGYPVGFTRVTAFLNYISEITRRPF